MLNVHALTEHVPGVANGIADSLSFSVGQVPGVGFGGRSRRDPVPWIPLATSIDSSGVLIRRSVSEGTWASYSRDWSEWEELLGFLGIRFQ